MDNETLIEDQLRVQEEIDNIRSILEATKENIDALNARFEKFSPPPKMYLENLRVSRLKIFLKRHSMEFWIFRISPIGFINSRRWSKTS